MRYLHHDDVMILQLRSYLVVIEEGSLHRAATRLNLSQSALSRQMQALEHELGGKLLERSSTGVRPTLGGHAMAAKVRALLGNYDSVMLEVRRLVRGQSEELRIGYLGSAFEEYLAPALKKLYKVHPRTKVQLLDLFPGEQIAALRNGEIDIGLTLETGALLGRDFYTRKLAADKSVAFLPRGHPLASRKELRDRKSTRLNSSHQIISYAVFCLKKKKSTKETGLETRERIWTNYRRHCGDRTMVLN